MKLLPVIAATGIASVLLAGCGGGSGDAAPPTTGPGPTTSASADAMTADLVGGGCTGYLAGAAKDDGLDKMADVPLVTAAGKNPQLSTFVKAVTGKLNPKVNLETTLDGKDYTVFAPTDAAFAKLPAATLQRLKTDQMLLIRTLMYHAIASRLSSAQLPGTQRTVQSGTLKIVRSGKNMTVNGANVLCGGVKTANANLYLLDTVLAAPATK